MSVLNSQRTHFRPAGLLGLGPVLKSEGDFEESELGVRPAGLLGMGPVITQSSDGIEDQHHFRPAGLLGLGPLLEHRIVNQASVPVSNTLRAALRDGGWWPLAHAVKTAEGLAPPADPTLQSVVQSLAFKVAADRATQQEIQEGLDALRRVRGAK